MTTRHERAASCRQAAIDYIIAHPGATAPEIIKTLANSPDLAVAVGWTNKATSSDRLADMVDHRELAREKTTITTINASGARSVINTYAYTALTDKTKGADKVAREVSANLASNRAEKPPEESPEPWRTVHIGGKRTDLKDQRGQGAVRHSVRRGCSMSGL